MTLILSNDDVEELLSVRECIDVLEKAYLELADGTGVARTRSDSIVTAKQPDTLYSLKSMDGVIPGLGVSAVRIDSDLVTYPTTVVIFVRDWRTIGDISRRRHAAHSGGCDQRTGYQVFGKRGFAHRWDNWFRLAGWNPAHGRMRHAQY